MDDLFDEVFPRELCACPQCGFTLVDTRTDISDPALKEDVGLLLQSNDPPLQAVEHDLRQQYMEAEKYSDHLDTQIARLQSSIQALSQERGNVQGFLEKYKTVLHPIRRLPGDVLNLIFTLSHNPPDLTELDEDEDLNPAYHAYHAKPPWTLAQVCRSWRHYATSLSSLWSFVYLDLQPLPYAHAESTRNWTEMSLLALQVQRTGNYPITLHVQSEGSSSIKNTRIMQNYPPLAIMFSTSQRWKILRLQLSHSELLVLNTVKGSLQSLQELQINLPRKHPEFALVDVFEFAPALERLVLGGNADLALSDLALPWSQLREFRWSSRIGRRQNINNKYHLDLLSRMPNLRYCSLQDVAFSSDPARTPLQMLSLQTLILEEKYRAATLSFEEILNALYAPCLQELWLMGLSQQLTDLAAFQNFIRRSGSPLRTLFLSNLQLESHKFAALLKSLPASIQNLALDSRIGIDDTVFYALRHDLDKRPILPKLEFLDVRGTKTCNDDAFLDMLESRVMLRAGHSELTRLKVLQVEQGRYQSVLDHARMFDLRFEGLEAIEV